jgi:ABC-2 type transport system ATP-binding protein/sodium transport system ATP-binding protein
MIVASGLVKRFSSGNDTVTAVDGISFHVSSGEVYGLLGPNGAGKTTTLRMIMGMLEPDEGYAEVGGIRTGRDSTAVRGQIGHVSSNDGVYPWLSVREMLLYFADLYDVAPEKAHQRITYLSELLDLKKFIDQRSATLSTGQKQRVSLARGLVHDPPVMLLDEPTRGLDVLGSKVIFEFIGILRKQGKAVLVSTHRLDEAERLCDRFGLLNRGHIEHEGTLPELKEATGHAHLVDMFLDLLGYRGSMETIPWQT